MTRSPESALPVIALRSGGVLETVDEGRTGTFYDAPYDSYDVNGANGPGYYKDDQKLNIINRQ